MHAKMDIRIQSMINQSYAIVKKSYKDTGGEISIASIAVEESLSAKTIFVYVLTNNFYTNPNTPLPTIFQNEANRPRIFLSKFKPVFLIAKKGYCSNWWIDKFTTLPSISFFDGGIGATEHSSQGTISLTELDLKCKIKYLGVIYNSERQAYEEAVADDNDSILPLFNLTLAGAREIIIRDKYFRNKTLQKDLLNIKDKSEISGVVLDEERAHILIKVWNDLKERETML